MAELLSFCGGPFQTNGYLVDCGEKCVLFDAPMDLGDWLRDNDKKVDLLILTHLHHDHIMDAGAIAEQFECPIWAHSDPCEELTLHANLEALTGMKWDLREFSIDRHLDEGPDLEIGDRTFQILHIPGHSPDSLCFHDEENRFVIGGDVLFQNGIGRTDFPNGNHAELIAGIKEKLWPLPDDTTVYPGHGPPTQIGFEKETNPFLRD